uniref:catechol O-methyltransferase n=1 Tax=Alexandrium catenella TaxID=2925 RepID=A0A7S1WLI2_ALECA|mmetsp:Transcript_72066/g.191505  ORF Transcript_72066/g.191505 Transcript_72066/m.191505 type:complete len:306 (+) Transcript_72066:430-1347(+)
MQPASGNHWQKLGSLIEFVEERLPWAVPTMPGSAVHFARLLETFAQSREHWLKVAGGAKAEVLEHSFTSRVWKDFEVAVECGTFVGYSASRLAVQMHRHGGGPAAARVITIEVDPVHACIARHFLDLAGVSFVVEVSVGQVRDVVPRLVDCFGARALGFVFMDYKGSIFHADLELLEHIDALGIACVELADNVALPGAPLLLWNLAFGPSWDLHCYAMTEFFEPNTEDWMAVGTYKGRLGEAPPAPVSWQRLSWHTDHMRRRAGGLRPTEGDMFEEDRIAYSRHVRRHFLAAGIKATPWRGPSAE